MATQAPIPFEALPRTPQGHFTLCFYAAVYRLLERLTAACAESRTDTTELFSRFPFLAEYCDEAWQHMPAGMSWSEGVQWWETAVLRWEAGVGAHLPLRALAASFDLSFTGRMAFMLAGVAEEDARFGGLFEEIQEPPGCRRPTLQLVGQSLTGAAPSWYADAWTICRPLLDAGLLDVADRDAARSEWLLRVPTALWSAARGDVASQPWPRAHHHAAATFPQLSELIYSPELLERVRRIPELVANGAVRSVIVRAPEGSDPLEVLGGVARALGLGLVVVDRGDAAGADLPTALVAFCTMTAAMPVVRYDLGPGETATPTLPHGTGPIGIAMGLEGGVGGDAAERAITVVLPVPDAPLRVRHWSAALNGRLVDAAAVARTFHLSGRYIQQLAPMAAAQAHLSGRSDVSLQDVREASRALNRQLLDTLASRLEARGCWPDLVASDTTAAKLQEVERRCRHREALLERLGAAFANGTSHGVRALFTGASGTGKTMAARILGAELGMDVYRVDLAAVVNKYIGETEKNLNRVLSRAEALDVVLLLDEGDALLGQRTTVKSAHDRYANLETNYLLQRLEHYRGVVIVTTNLGDNIDTGFQRRMDVVVPFFPPGVEERLRILDLHLPPTHTIGAAYLRDAARRCALTGAQLRNVALHATLLAIDDGELVEARHLQAALRSEFRKAGGTFPLEVTAPTREADGGMGTFASALEAR